MIPTLLDVFNFNLTVPLRWNDSTNRFFLMLSIILFSSAAKIERGIIIMHIINLIILKYNFSLT